jgi:hypothetical protein
MEILLLQTDDVKILRPAAARGGRPTTGRFGNWVFRFQDPFTVARAGVGGRIP